MLQQFVAPMTTSRSISQVKLFNTTIWSIPPYVQPPVIVQYRHVINTISWSIPLVIVKYPHLINTTSLSTISDWSILPCDQHHHVINTTIEWHVINTTSNDWSILPWNNQYHNVIDSTIYIDQYHHVINTTSDWSILLCDQHHHVIDQYCHEINTTTWSISPCDQYHYVNDQYHLVINTTTYSPPWHVR